MYEEDSATPPPPLPPPAQHYLPIHSSFSISAYIARYPPLSPLLPPRLLHLLSVVPPSSPLHPAILRAALAALKRGANSSCYRFVVGKYGGEELDEEWIRKVEENGREMEAVLSQDLKAAKDNLVKAGE